MGIYQRWIFPRLIGWAMANTDLLDYRRRLVPRARGQVLEIGIGSGLNLPLYGPAVDCITGLDPSRELLVQARCLASRLHRPVHLVRAAAEAIPAREETFDTVVLTWTLCSVPDPLKALKEIRRVLKPGGSLLFVEHGLAPEPGVETWQYRLDPLWARISCHLDRPVPRLIKEAGFSVTELKTGYLPRGPKPIAFMYEGCARPA